MIMNIKTVSEKAQEVGLLVRGGFTVTPADDVPEMSDGSAAASLLLLGNVGSSLWPSFSISREYDDGEANPLDRWSRRVGDSLAMELDAAAYYPFGGPPYQPFIRWAQKAEQMRASKIGLLLHPEFGLWHAYRLALVFPMAFEELQATHSEQHHACDGCSAQPCLSACPVDAFSDAGYDVVRCIQYLDQHSDASCHQQGCQARMSCPEGEQYRYEQAHAAFHMRQFFNTQLKTMKNKHG